MMKYFYVHVTLKMHSSFNSGNLILAVVPWTFHPYHDNSARSSVPLHIVPLLWVYNWRLSSQFSRSNGGGLLLLQRFLNVLRSVRASVWVPVLPPKTHPNAVSKDVGVLQGLDCRELQIFSIKFEFNSNRSMYCILPSWPYFGWVQ